jgi:hypothetical protein
MVWVIVRTPNSQQNSVPVNGLLLLPNTPTPSLCSRREWFSSSLVKYPAACSSYQLLLSLIYRNDAAAFAHDGTVEAITTTEQHMTTLLPVLVTQLWERIQDRRPMDYTQNE